MRILLLQARTSHDPAKHNERVSFAHKARLPVEALTPFDLLAAPPTLAEMQAYDAVMVGGSGDYYVSKGNLPHYTETKAALLALVETGHPMFASCFGYQVLVDAMGGEIVYLPEKMEVGSYQLTLTPEGKEDALLGTFPEMFTAQLGHQDQATRLPKGTLNLASSERSPYQAFRVPGKPIWATQFHPELSRSENLKRFNRYLDTYSKVMTPEERETATSNFRESPETETLIGKFIEYIQTS